MAVHRSCALQASTHALVILLCLRSDAIGQPDSGSRATFPVGNYRAADGSYLALFSAALGAAFLDYRGGRLGVLHPLGGDKYGAGPGASAGNRSRWRSP